MTHHQRLLPSEEFSLYGKRHDNDVKTLVLINCQNDMIVSDMDKLEIRRLKEAIFLFSHIVVVSHISDLESNDPLCNPCTKGSLTNSKLVLSLYMWFKVNKTLPLFFDTPKELNKDHLIGSVYVSGILGNSYSIETLKQIKSLVNVTVVTSYDLTGIVEFEHLNILFPLGYSVDFEMLKKMENNSPD